MSPPLVGTDCPARDVRVKTACSPCLHRRRQSQASGARVRTRRSRPKGRRLRRVGDGCGLGPGRGVRHRFDAAPGASPRPRRAPCRPGARSRSARPGPAPHRRRVVEGTAADAWWRGEFELATMVSHAFQCLVTDDELRASLIATGTALCDHCLFAFETRNGQARAFGRPEPRSPARTSREADEATKTTSVSSPPGTWRNSRSESIGPFAP